MKLDSIHHVAIIVSDYERSKNFYVNLLGFEIIRENYRKERGDYKLDLKLGSKSWYGINVDGKYGAAGLDFAAGSP